jgi:hypothetical protein
VILSFGFYPKLVFAFTRAAVEGWMARPAAAGV